MSEKEVSGKMIGQGMTIRIELKEPTEDDEVLYRSKLDSVIFIWYEKDNGKRNLIARPIFIPPTQFMNNHELERYLAEERNLVIQSAVSECIEILMSEV
jgi:hypothetical protein